MIRNWRVWTVLILCVSILLTMLETVEASPAKDNITKEQHAAVLNEQERAERLQQLEQVTEQLYQDMQQGNTTRANDNMDKLTDTLGGLSFKGLTSVEGIHALAETIMDTKATLVRVELNAEDWVITSARLRLAVNSLTHKEKALWLQYYKVMADDLHKMNRARAEGSPSQFKAGFESLQSHYDVIRPAAIISRDAADMNRFDSWMSYIAGLARGDSWDENAVREALRHGDDLIRKLFGRKSDDPVFLPITGYNNPWYWTLLIGAWIMIALLYTGYRKFRGNEKVTSLRDRSDRADSYRY
ncbi:Sporulation protein YpjB (SpoYpjB) [compost metagenome]